MLRGDGFDAALERCAVGVSVRIAVRVDEQRPNAAASGFLHEIRAAGGWDGEKGGIDRLGKRRQRRIAFQIVEFR